jgi:hypothetical protein
MYIPMMYIEPVKFSSTNNYGSGPAGEDDVYTIDEFKEHCESGGFIDYDGFGHPVKDSKCDPSFIVKPSEIENIPVDATHVVWYNR